MSKYKSVVTTLGQARIASAIESGKDVNITQLAVGDGNGNATEPSVGQTALVHETYRLKLNSIKIDNKNANWIIAEAIIPAEIGGFWMREMGLFSAEGELIAVSNMADSYKPTLEEGSGRTQTLRMVLTVTDTDAVSLTIDDTLIIATEEYVNNLLAEHEASRRHPDGTLTAKGFVQLSSAVDSTSEILAATPKAVKTSYDLAKSANDNANGRLPSGGTAVAANKLSTARKIAGVAFDGTADINLSAGNVGAVPATGGDVGYLENSSRYKIKAGTWEGVGSFATQYKQPYAPFLIPFGYAVPADVSNYSPLLKGIVQTQKYGYGASVSFGAYTPGDAHFPSAVIHVIGDDGTSAAWFFDSNDGGFISPGAISSSTDVHCTGLYNTFINTGRLFATTPPNPNAGQGLHIGWNESSRQGEANFVCNMGGGTGGFTFRTVNKENTLQAGIVTISGDGTLTASGSMGTTTGGVYDRGNHVYSAANPPPCVSDVALGAQGSMIVNNPVTVPAGCTMTGWYTEGQNPGGDTIYYRPIQKYTPQYGWMTIGHTA